MQHVLAQVAELGATQVSAPVGLTVGKINHAAALYGAFVVDADKQGLTQLESLKVIADSGITFTEFAKACKDSQTIADNVDKGAGFTPAADAKGIDKYGPKRRLLNQRLSEAKQLFGVFKMAPAILAEKGYWPALTAAREYLSNQGIKWDASKAEEPEAKAQRLASKANQEAIAQALADNPMEAGETRAAYLERVDAIAQEALEAAEAEAFNKVVKTLHDAMMKKHGADVLSGVMQMMLETMDDDSLNSTCAWIQEEIVVRSLEQPALV